MLLTTKGRYAVSAIIDLAKNNKDCNVSPRTISDISEKQNISVSYLEQIFNKLKKAGIVNSVKGPGGGYMLSDVPEQINISDIIRAVEEPIKFTKCNDHVKCNKNEKCQTHNLWKGLENHVIAYLSNISVADVCRENSLATNI